MVNKSQNVLYLDHTQPLEARIGDLISRMTLDEKISQVINDAEGIERLNIPKYNWWSEALHGVGFSGIATVFPQAIGLAASFNVNLMAEVADAISTEGRAKHHEAVRNNSRKIFQGLTFWSPNVNIFRDPRWGRGQETYGEDPFLTSKMGITFIQNLQGDDPRYLKLVATPKHYIAYSGLESERHFFDAKVSNKDLWETYMPAFEACIIEGQAEAIMGAYNRVNGELCCASKFLLKEVLRDKWGFKGHVVSDCGAINDIFKHHKVVETPEEAAALAFNSGLDLICKIGVTRRTRKERWKWLKDAVEKELLKEFTLDESLKNLFRAKFLLGMFDPPELVKYTKIPYEKNDCKEHRQLALEAARESIVLLKNQDGILPLRKDVNTIAVIGPNADNRDVLLGNYNGEPSEYTTILEGIKNRTSPDTEILFAKGCPLKEKSKEGFEEAKTIAQKSDIVFLVLGISPRLEGEEGQASQSDLGGDRLDINLPGVQEDLLKEIFAIGKQIILILTGGSAISVNFAQENIPAILFVWYPGEEGGNAVADVIFGDYNPAGRLPVTFYKSIEQLPEFRNYSMEGRTYRYFKDIPLYSFGFGLSYTKFRYSNLSFSNEMLDVSETLEVEAEIENIGGSNGEEVIQLYISRKDARFRVPIRELKGFKRIFLKKDQRKKISFKLMPKDFSVVNLNGERFLEPGMITISIGGCQPGYDLEKDGLVMKDVSIIGKAKHLE